MPKSKQASGNAGYKTGKPKPLRQLTDEGQAIWDWLCDQIPKDRLSPADAMHLTACVDQWLAYDRLYEIWLGDPADARLHRQMNNAWSVVDSIGRQYGLTLVSRARMPGGKAEEDKPENPLAQILKMRDAKRKQG